MEATGILDVDVDVDVFVDLDGDGDVDLDERPVDAGPAWPAGAAEANGKPRRLFAFRRSRDPGVSNAFASRRSRTRASSTPWKTCSRSTIGPTTRPDRRWSQADTAKHYKIARGEAMERAASRDVMKLREAVSMQRYEHGIRLLASVVAMLTKRVQTSKR